MKKNEWGDIAPLDGLEMDWEYRPDTRDGKRMYKRLSRQDLGHLYGAGQVAVKMASATTNCEATLRDLSEGGLGIDLACRIDEFQHFKVGLVLGRDKIIAGAQVRHVRQSGHGFTAGLKFINLEPSIHDAIADMYAAKVLRHGY